LLHNPTLLGLNPDLAGHRIPGCPGLQRDQQQEAQGYRHRQGAGLVAAQTQPAILGIKPDSQMNQHKPHQGITAVVHQQGDEAKLPEGIEQSQRQGSSRHSTDVDQQIGAGGRSQQIHQLKGSRFLLKWLLPTIRAANLADAATNLRQKVSSSQIHPFQSPLTMDNPGAKDWQRRSK
jgi:hypothetical protein